MKKSAAVTLILSGSLLTGCEPDYNSPPSADNTVYTNNTYRAGFGYWHAPYGQWYPYPYNYYSPTMGYYHGGSWSSRPEIAAARSSSSYGGGIAGISHGNVSRVGESSIARGGFGSVGRGGSS